MNIMFGSSAHFSVYLELAPLRLSSQYSKTYWYYSDNLHDHKIPLKIQEKRERVACFKNGFEEVALVDISVLPKNFICA